MYVWYVFIKGGCMNIHCKLGNRYFNSFKLSRPPPPFNDLIRFAFSQRLHTVQ